MASVCFYFQVHQPFRVKDYRVFDIGNDSEYFNDDSDRSINNKKILHKVAGKCYLPANAVLLELLNKHPEFKISFSFSGVFLEQLELFSPETLASFQKLVATGRVELLEETYYHSLSFLYSPEEFRRQVLLHRAKIKKLFGVTPMIFRNTELIYNNALAHEVESMGYKGILAEGADHVLGWRSPNFLYSPQGTSKLKLLLKNYRLSDDIAFRFSSRDWAEFPLTAPKFANWVSQVNGSGNVVNLFMDYETFGEHQWEDTGIFNFLRHLPEEILRHPDNDFVTPSEAVARYAPVAELDVHHFVSWADIERDLSAWLSNPMQHDAIRSIYGLEKEVMATGDARMIDDWRRLQTSDHFYYMCTKWFSDGDVHKYFNPYNTPYEAFIAYMNVLQDLRLRIYAHRTAKKHAVEKMGKSGAVGVNAKTAKCLMHGGIEKKKVAVRRTRTVRA
jgi:alpha-amylase